MQVPSIIIKKRILDGLWFVGGSPGSLIWHLLGEGGAVLCSFIDWFLLLLVARCLLAWCLSRVSCVRERASYLHLFGLSSLELGSSLCR